MENSEWLPIDLLELIEPKDRPRVLKVQMWEINPLGKFRYLDPIRGNYHEAKLVTIDGEKYFAAIIGSSGGNLIVKKWRVKDLLRRYFRDEV